MALTEVLRSDTFEQWRTKTNTISSDLGDRATLSANITANTSLVGAINELQGDIGVIGSLSTFAASNIVDALNELKTGSSVTISGTKTFSSNVNLSSGQAYTINGTSVLTATALGSGVIGSSLTSLGTIGTGVWQGSSIDIAYTDAKIKSIAGTANRVTVSNTSGAVTLTLPQDIHTAASPSFASVTANSVILGSAANTISTSSGNLTLASSGGSVAITGNSTVSGTLDASGKTQVITTLANTGTVLAVVNNNSTYTDSFPVSQRGANRFLVGADGSVEIKGDLLVRGATTISGATTLSADFNTLVNKPTPVVQVTISGDISGTGSASISQLETGTYTASIVSTIGTAKVLAANIATDAVETAKIKNANVTNEKLANSSITVSTGTGLSGGSTVSLGGNVTLTNSDRGSSQNIFKNIAVAGQNTVVADNNDDTLTVASDASLLITTNSATDTITIAHSDTSSLSGSYGSSGISSITVDGLGHVTAVSTATYLTTAVTSLTGTANQVISSGSTGAITLSLPQSIATTSNVTFGSVTTSGNVVVGGNLTVSGTTTSINTTTLDVADLNITVAKNATTAAAADGAGLTVGNYVSNPTLLYTNASNRWVMNRGVEGSSFVRTGGASNQFLKADGSIDSSTYLTGNQTISISGDASGSGTTAITLTLANSGVSIGTYNNVTVDAKGRVTSGSNVAYLTTAVTSATAGTGISVSSSTGSVTFTNTGVTSIAGTTNQVTASASTGGVTLSLPQSINTGASVQFGSLGVGTAATGTSGEIRATNNITAYYSSDERLKTNVRKIENALDKVSQINGVVYDWNDTYKKSHGDIDGYFVRNDNSGVIAQEIEKVFPNVVADRPDGFKAVRYELLVPLLIEAIKDLKAEIESLKANK